MKATVSLSDFNDAFITTGRKENFSWVGRTMLFDYLEQCEEDSGEEMELDVIALCCEWYEAETLDIIFDYGVDVEGVEPDELDAFVADYLSDNTIYIGSPTDGSHLFAAF